MSRNDKDFWICPSHNLIRGPKEKCAACAAELDYADMRRFQKYFIKADRLLQEARFFIESAMANEPSGACAEGRLWLYAYDELRKGKT